jgi:gliding motility-associated transport system ATP-binding protein
VTLRVSGVAAAAVSARLHQIPQARRVAVLEEINGVVAVCVHPKPDMADGELPRAVSEAAQGWRIQQLQTEEGRLDEVFRSLTMPDTESRKSEARGQRSE